MGNTTLSTKILKFLTTFLNIFVFGILLSSSLTANGDIEETQTFEPIVKYFENINPRKNPEDSRKILMLDVDLVLIMPKDQCLHPKYRKITDKELEELLKGAPKEDYWSHVLETHPRELVDEQAVPPFLDSLREKEIATIAFTNAPTGVYGHYSKLEQWRLDEMKTFKLDFSYSFPKKTYIEFCQIKTKNKFPLFKEGVLFSDLLPKGELIPSFFGAIEGFYDEVISVDDKREELESEKIACQKIGKKFKGFHYTAAMNKPVAELNTDRMKYQVRTLVQKKRWLSDAEADEELSKQ